MRIIFLGTSGSLPTPRRNLPSICLLREGEMILFDCGEGTQTQIMRKGVGFAGLNRIFISHLHGDHLSGLMGLLMSLTLLEHDRPLTVYGPPELKEFIHSLEQNIHLRCDFVVDIKPVKKGVIVEEEQYVIEAQPVRHSIPCFAFALQEKVRPGRFNLEKARELGITEGPLYGQLQQGNAIKLSNGRTIKPEQVLGPPRRGRRIVYVTDTLYMPSLVDFCRDADLLIHEGMFTEDMIEEAKFRKHATAAQAATLARDANVKKLILIHISPRYRHRSELRDEAKKIFPETEVAKDLMEIEIPYSVED